MSTSTLCQTNTTSSRILFHRPIRLSRKNGSGKGKKDEPYVCIPSPVAGTTLEYFCWVTLYRSSSLELGTTVTFTVG